MCKVMTKISSEPITKPSTRVVLPQGPAEASQALLQTSASLIFLTVAHTPPFFPLLHGHPPVKNLNSFLNQLHLATSLKCPIPKTTLPFTHHALSISRMMAASILSDALTDWDICTLVPQNPQKSKALKQIGFNTISLDPFSSRFELISFVLFYKHSQKRLSIYNFLKFETMN